MDWRPAFLAALEQRACSLDACKAVPVDPSTVYRERQRNPEFADAYETARQVGALTLEQEATRRAVQGVQRLKFHNGQVVMVPTGKMVQAKDGAEVPEMVPYVEHEYSDRLLELLLKRHFPAEYREKLADVNVTANASASVTVTSDDELASFQAAREKFLRRLDQPGQN